MAIGVSPTALATRRMVTASAPPLLSRRRLVMAILSATGLADMYTVYTLMYMMYTRRSKRSGPSSWATKKLRATPSLVETAFCASAGRWPRRWRSLRPEPPAGVLVLPFLQDLPYFLSDGLRSAGLR